MNQIEDPNQAPSESLPFEPLIITEDIRSYMYDMAKWTKFLSIVGFVMTALVVFAAIGSTAFMNTLSTISPGNPMAAMGSGFLTVYLFVIGILYFYPSLLMFKHSNAAKKAILFGEQESLSVAMQNLKSFFKFWGVLMIVLIVFYGMVVIAAIAVSVTAASAGA